MPRHRSGSRSRFPCPTAPLPTLAIFFLLSYPGHGEETTPQIFGEVIDVHVVNVEVRVTDRRGRPITGLSADDFVLREDGERVEISGFLEVSPLAREEGDAAEAPVATTPPGEPESLPSRLLVIHLDDFAIDRQNRRLALRDLHDLVSRGLEPDTRIALTLYDGKLRMVEKPTADRDRLLAALEAVKAVDSQGLLRYRERQSALAEVLAEVAEIRQEVRAGVREVGEAVRYLEALTRRVEIEAEQRGTENRGSFAALGTLVDTLAPLAGRKALVYISEGLPMHPGQAALAVINDALTELTSGGGGGSAGESINARSAALGALMNQTPSPTRRAPDPEALPDDLFAVTALAANAGVAFYPWKALGDAAGVPAAVGGDAGLELTPQVRSGLEQSLTATLSFMATETGGKMMVGAGVDILIARALDDFGGYYSLGFSPEHGRDNLVHELKVKVRRSRVKVWHPKTYIARPLEPLLAHSPFVEGATAATDPP